VAETETVEQLASECSGRTAEGSNPWPQTEVERYRQASEDALQQLDGCIGYMHASGKRRIPRSLHGRNPSQTLRR
jgi:hypothetical protein